jgi:hypothetical protein
MDEEDERRRITRDARDGRTEVRAATEAAAFAGTGQSKNSIVVPTRLANTTCRGELTRTWRRILAWRHVECGAARTTTDGRSGPRSICRRSEQRFSVLSEGHWARPGSGSTRSWGGASAPPRIGSRSRRRDSAARLSRYHVMKAQPGPPPEGGSSSGSVPP